MTRPPHHSPYKRNCSFKSESLSFIANSFEQINIAAATEQLTVVSAIPTAVDVVLTYIFSFENDFSPAVKNCQPLNTNAAAMNRKTVVEVVAIWCKTSGDINKITTTDHFYPDGIGGDATNIIGNCKQVINRFLWFAYGGWAIRAV